MEAAASGRANGFGAVVKTASPALLYGVRLSASVLLALFVAYELQLDNAFWAGTSAGIVCQPSLGASLRKGWFRAIGTAIGAVAIVLLTALFPQDRVGMLVALALWCGLCGFMATVLRNFAGYAAALAGYTAVIVFADAVSAPGEAFMLAVSRGTEICIGIVCAGLVVALTDFGGARQRLERMFAATIERIVSGLGAVLAAGRDPVEIRDGRRALIEQAITLHVAIDEAIGESPELRYRRRTLHAGTEGLFSALASWRGIAAHLDAAMMNDTTADDTTANEAKPDNATTSERRDDRRGDSRAVARQLLAFLPESPTATPSFIGATKRLLALPAPDIASRFLVDNLARALLGLHRAARSLALIDGRRRTPPPARRAVFAVPDLLPAAINGLRVALALACAELFWIETAWSSGPTMIIFAAVGTILFSPRNDDAYDAVLGFAIGTMLAAGVAGIVNFAVLPAFTGFLGFAFVIAAVLTPLGALSATSWWKSGFIGMATNFIPLLGPSNLPSYDIAGFLNGALAILAGTVVAALAIRLVPPLSPAYRTRRLLDRVRRDLRRIAAGRRRPDRGAWTATVSQLLGALPAQATALQRAQLIAALSVGDAVIYLRRPHASLDALGERKTLDAALNALARGDVASVRANLARFETAHREESRIDIVRCRVAAMVIADALGRHEAFFSSTPGARGEAEEVPILPRLGEDQDLIRSRHAFH